MTTSARGTVDALPAGENGLGEPAFQVEVYVLRHALAFFIP